jgi:hypothetical protein
MKTKKSMRKKTHEEATRIIDTISTWSNLILKSITELRMKEGAVWEPLWIKHNRGT